MNMMGLHSATYHLKYPKLSAVILVNSTNIATVANRPDTNTPVPTFRPTNSLSTLSRHDCNMVKRNALKLYRKQFRSYNFYGSIAGACTASNRKGAGKIMRINIVNFLLKIVD